MKFIIFQLIKVNILFKCKFVICYQKICASIIINNERVLIDNAILFDRNAKIVRNYNNNIFIKVNLFLSFNIKFTLMKMSLLNVANVKFDEEFDY